ncbi:MAG TPA: HU family DNA-binding protein, partial [Acidimicrobiales bacterium]|nr:HU family DNA-binding protein [Acidimicrobiales bacterium]
MNRRELIRAVAAHTADDAKHVESIISGVTDVITAVVAKGEAVTIQGFQVREGRAGSPHGPEPAHRR